MNNFPGMDEVRPSVIPSPRASISSIRRPVLALIATGVSAALVLTTASAQQPFSHEGALACLQCHESDKVMGIADTPHADFDNPRSPASSHEQCESCHGPSATHMQFPMQVGNIVFTKHAKTPLAERNQACLQCHEDGEQAHWSEGVHGRKLSCPSCHVIHQPNDPTLAIEGQAQRCGECHEPILTTAPTNAPHPISGEEALSCTQCHNPHGKTSLATCVGCHAQDQQTLARQTPKARDYHERAVSREIPCTSCHKAIVHAMPQISRVQQSRDEAGAR
jgi:nitrate/TMAO reductase-like tetraheme cytochrome c subunit